MLVRDTVFPIYNTEPEDNSSPNFNATCDDYSVSFSDLDMVSDGSYLVDDDDFDSHNDCYFYN